MTQINYKIICKKNATVACMLLLAFSLLFGCKKFVEVPPPSTSLIGSSIFTNDANAEAALNGIYGTMVNSSLGGGINGVSVMAGLSADEIALYPGAPALQSQAYSNSLLSTNPANFWFDCYNMIYQTNAAINGIPLSSGMTNSIKQQLLGESLFLRAYCYFYLINLYGDVPLVITINYQTNESLVRTPKKLVYQQMIADLTKADTLLSDNYLNSSGAISTERVRPNKEAAAALLARVYLYTGDWNNAAKKANQVISSGIYTLNTDLNQAFLSTSTEAIWQLELAPTSYTNTNDGFTFLYPLLDGGGPSSNYPVYLSNSLAHSFEPGDLRRADWVDSINAGGTTYYYPFKYKQFILLSPPPTEYPMMLRYGEQFLILSEAYAHLGNAPQAIASLNVVRKRAGLPHYTGTTTDTTSLLTAILRERRVELFTENGHRWFDIKRTETSNSVMGPPGNACVAKGGTWNTNWQLYPIPLTDIQADQHLSQNLGYQ